MSPLSPHTAMESENAALLEISGLGIVLPQREIIATEPASAVDSSDAQPFSVGWVHHAGQRWPVYCLAPELSLLIVIPPERSACVVLASSGGFLGIVCDQVTALDAGAILRQALPPAMRLPDTPVLGLVALGEDRVACASNAQNLAAHISRLTGL